MSKVVDAIAEWRSQKISREAVIRRILADENMGLVVGPDSDCDSSRRFVLSDAKLVPDATGRARICLFTAGYKSDVFDAEAEAAGGVTYANPTGWEIFAVELDGVDAVVIDPGAPHEFVIERAEFAGLKELAEAVGIEEVWQRIRDGDEREDDVPRAARYPAYRVAAVRREGGAVLIYTPNATGHRLIPIFTHTDTLALAIDHFRETFAPAEVKMMELSGAQIFPVLAQQKDAHGIVFNFWGPGEAIAFQLGIVDLMLEELAKG